MVSLMLGTIRLKYIPDRNKLLTAGCDPYLANTSWNQSQGIDGVDPSIFDHAQCFSAPQMVVSIAMLGGILMVSLCGPVDLHGYKNIFRPSWVFSD